MKFLIDENVGGSIIRYLRDQGHDLVCIAETRHGMPDDQILTLAVREKRILLTYDKDFGDLVFRDRKPHGGVILIRLGVDNVQYHLAALKQFLKKHSEEEIRSAFWRLDGDYAEYFFEVDRS